MKHLLFSILLSGFVFSCSSLNKSEINREPQQVIGQIGKMATPDTWNESSTSFAVVKIICDGKKIESTYLCNSNILLQGRPSSTKKGIWNPVSLVLAKKDIHNLPEILPCDYISFKIPNNTLQLSTDVKRTTSLGCVDFFGNPKE